VGLLLFMLDGHNGTVHISFARLLPMVTLTLSALLCFILCTDGFDSTVGSVLVQFIVDGHHDTVDSGSCHGWPQWHCPFLLPACCSGGGYFSTFTPVVQNPTDGHVDTVGYVAVDQYPDLLARSFSCQWPQWLCWLLACSVQCCVPLPSSRDSFRIFGGTPSLSIDHVLRYCCHGLSALLAVSLVDARCCELLWEMRIDLNIPLHGVDSLAADLVAANF
jgi:hypothetical protein